MTGSGRRIYVSVDVEFKEDGQMLPRTIAPGDGKRYRVDRVLDVNGVVIALSFVAVQLIFVVSGNARVGGDLSPDTRLYWRCCVPAHCCWNRSL